MEMGDETTVCGVTVGESSRGWFDSRVIVGNGGVIDMMQVIMSTSEVAENLEE